MRLIKALAVILGLLIFVVPSYAAKLHIDPGARASGDGTVNSPLKSWDELPKMSNGDDVYFRCGSIYEPNNYLNITWEGTESNPAVIGAYYIKNGVPIYGVDGERPIINGRNRSVPDNIYFGQATQTIWKGLISVIEKDYVHIQDLQINESGFVGVWISGNTNANPQTNSAHFLVKNVKVYGSTDAGIVVANNPRNYGIIENCEVTRSAYAWYMGLEKRGWPVCLMVSNSPYANTIVKNNYVHENWGEGIGVIRVASSSDTDYSGHVLIEDNVIWNNRRVDIYVDRTENNEIRRNICIGAGADAVGTFRSADSDGRGWNQFGIWINSEDRGQLSDATRNNKVYNNIVAGHYNGIGISSAYLEGKMENNVFYGNTAIANRYNFVIGNTLSNYQMQNIIFKNNISYCPPETICQDINQDFDWIDSKVEANYNAWTKIPSNWGGKNDVKVDNTWGKVYGWQDLNTIPDIKSFSPLSGNPVVDSGMTLSKQYANGIDTLNTKYSLGSPLGISVATTLQDSNGAGWERGAIVYQDESTAQTGNPLSPPILTIIPSSK